MFILFKSFRFFCCKRHGHGVVVICRHIGLPSKIRYINNYYNVSDHDNWKRYLHVTCKIKLNVFNINTSYFILISATFLEFKASVPFLWSMSTALYKEGCWFARRCLRCCGLLSFTCQLANHNKGPTLWTLRCGHERGGRLMAGRRVIY